MKENNKIASQNASTVDADEIARFTAMADEWWDVNGKFKPLHSFNPIRLQWIIDQLGGEVSGLSILDIGCGGGLVSEPLAARGAKVTGIDAGEKNIAVARLHAQKTGTDVDYRCTTAEALVETGAQYDAVLALEIVEHVADIDLFVAAAAKLVKPGGLLIFSTMNRTAKAYAFAIIGAEYVLRWLPVGTHSWKKFLRPSELAAAFRQQGVEVSAMTGLVMNVLDFTWSLKAGDMSVNYMIAGRK